MILEGAAPEQIDRVMYEFGLAMGPCDGGYGWARSRMVRCKMRGGSNEITARIPDALCELDRYGQKMVKGTTDTKRAAGHRYLTPLPVRSLKK